MAIMCPAVVKGKRCESKAKFYVAGTSKANRNWSGYYCEEHAPRVIKKRMRLIKMHKQYVTMRLMTAWDKKQAKERKRK